MARSTVYNADLVTPEDWARVEPQNIQLLEEFVNYLVASDKSPQTVKQYEAWLKVFFVWNLRRNNNKFFVDMKKREFMNFFGDGRLKYGWSPNRLSSMRAVLSSLSNFIERILDEDYPTFRNIVKVLEPINIEPVREKTIIDETDIMAGVERLVELGEIQLACWLSLLFSSGMRKSEAAQMKVEYFTTDKKIVFNNLAYMTPKIRTKGRGVKGKQIPRYIFRDTFDKYLDLWLNEREKLGVNSEYLFVIKGSEGEWRPATASTFSGWSKRVGEKIGVEDLYAHALRHAFTTELKKRGWPDSVVVQIMKWSDPKMLSIYNDNTEEDELSNFFSNLNMDGTYTVNNPLEGGDR